MSIEAGAIKYLADELCGSGLIRDEVRANIFKRLTEAEGKQEKKTRRLRDLQLGDTFKTGEVEWMVLDRYEVFKGDHSTTAAFVVETERSMAKRLAVAFGNPYYPESEVREEVDKIAMRLHEIDQYLIREDVSLMTASFENEEDSISLGVRLLTYEEIREYRKNLGCMFQYWTMTAWATIGDLVITATGENCRAAYDRCQLMNRTRLCCALDADMEIEGEEKE